MQKNRKDSSGQSPGGDGSNTNASHKKSLSGGLFSRFSFLRFSRDHDRDLDAAVPRRNSAEPYIGGRTGYGLDENGPTKSPGKRKNSLRKAALLGSGVQVKNMDNRLSRQPDSNEHIARLDTKNSSTRNVKMELGSPTSSSACSLPDSTTSGASNELHHAGPSRRDDTHTTIPTASTASFGDISTTEDEDNNTTASSPPYYQHLLSPSSSHHLIHEMKKNLPTHLSPGHPQPSHPLTTSYFPILSPTNHHRPPSSSTTTTPHPLLQRRHTLKRSKSPLSTSPARSLPLTPPTTQGGISTASETSLNGGEWDYTETEWWGWVVLFVTWLVFVVGMGSCLGVWSWAWDVGETPYAPPELEDDPTLPIVGYYPALIILTSVMAWVWVVVAWIGMKYFRHAKISGEDL